jgi:SAM-dependent methyltransferase
MKKYLWHLRHSAEADYLEHARRLLERREGSLYLDCGCGDGAKSLDLARRIGAGRIFGVEIVEEIARGAKARGITVAREDLNGPLSLPGGYFDAVTALEVIEHLHRPETFVKEIFRVLKPGGYAVVSTENIASWHNMFALLWGWQPFTLSQFSEKRTAVGNPWGLDRGEDWNPALRYPSFRHCLVFSHRGLKELFQLHGFTVQAVAGAGYYPLPPLAARTMSSLDPRHSAFLTMKARKPE